MHSLTFLGTSAGVPTRTRNVSALALQTQNSKAWTLFDCGEGTQHQILKSHLSAYHLSRIFITHLHGDHVYGLFGLLASKGMQRSPAPLEIYGPRGLKEMVRTVMRLSQLHLPFELHITEIGPGDRLQLEGFTLDVIPLSHSVTSYGFILAFDDTPGHLDTEKAKAAGIPEGPLYGRLKRGETVTLPDGRRFEGKDFLTPPTPGKRLALGGDNDEPMRFAPFAPFDLMVHEATYTQEDFDRLPRKFKHTTARQLGLAAQKMGLSKLILTHISPRYDTDGRILELLREVERVFDGEVEIAYDFMKIKF
ncbi:ribonuclease Z [Hydrogenimonas sp. SS33]|uniref:ribonuclease Z n=1 Tax=Hydrogenimonas leucolamina TaxID=2954236 RepID=UPI00336BD9AB